MTSEELIAFVVQFVIGMIGMPLVDFLKKKLGLESTAALFFAAAGAAVLGIGALFLSGEIGLVDFTWANLPNAFAAAFAAATLAYKLLNPTPQT